MPREGPSKSPVLASIGAVVERSQWVRFEPNGILPAVENWGNLLSASTSWPHPCHLCEGTEETVRWIFVLDILNHCFWPDPGEPVWTVQYNDQSYSGYWGLAASLRKALQNGYPITEASYLATMEAADLRAIFAGEGSIPMLDERLTNLHETGRILIERWEGDVVHMVNAADGCVLRLLKLVTDSFPSFRDEATYYGYKVCLWKRAQIFVSDLHAAFEGRYWGAFTDVEVLTAFADYKLPQVLRHLGIIAYQPALARKVDSRIPLNPGSPEEVEIRAMTVHAVEELKNTFWSEGILATSAEVDNWLWHLGQLEPFRLKPYHLCRTIYY